MTRQEQIEEMQKVIKDEQILIANDANEYKQLMQKGVDYCHAKALYDAGYRKADDVRKETAREILNLIIDEGNVNPLTSSYMLPFKIFNKIKREYGVEVEEQ